ncbi:helix-turn-helix domain-containing protein [Pedobacter hartonius]|nr:helix-turn-helix transcriptional regulator [Pedobacter hartonius]
MKSKTPKVTKIESISEIHRMAGIAGPVHPLISLMEARQVMNLCQSPVSYVVCFYMISFVTKLSGKFQYGQEHYDFDDGSLIFTAPNQVTGQIVAYNDNEGLSLFIHSDFLRGHPLAAKIKQFGFFSYAANEALHLSEQEKATMLSIYNIIREELNSRIDDFSQEVIIAQIELLLSYAKRFYKRQFITRQAVNNDLLKKLEELLDTYFEKDKSANQGVPTVQYLAEQLNYSPNYLSDLLRSLTGLTAQQHIHEKLIQRSKELLSSTELSISEVAYQLGFEHSQSFSRLFKNKTKLSPLEFRLSFN